MAIDVQNINLASLLLSILLGVFVFHPIIKILVKAVRVDSPNYEDQSSSLGMAERALYILAIYFNQLLFIGFWLTMKTAVSWSSWQNLPGDDLENKQKARARYLVFLYGSALSIIASVLAPLIVSQFF